MYTYIKREREREKEEREREREKEDRYIYIYIYGERDMIMFPPIHNFGSTYEFESFTYGTVNSGNRTY